MISVRQNLRLYDGNNTVLTAKGNIIRIIQNHNTTVMYRQAAILGPNLLADARVACKNIRIFCDSQFRWIGVTDLEDTAPLCKGGSVLFILRTALRQSIQTYGRGFHKKSMNCLVSGISIGEIVKSALNYKKKFFV